jgi:hypothetical protein
MSLQAIRLRFSFLLEFVAEELFFAPAIKRAKKVATAAVWSAKEDLIICSLHT